jgi:hypothetical protein
MQHAFLINTTLDMQNPILINTSLDMQNPILINTTLGSVVRRQCVMSLVRGSETAGNGGAHLRS